MQPIKINCVCKSEVNLALTYRVKDNIQYPALFGPCFDCGVTIEVIDWKKGVPFVNPNGQH